MRREVLKIGAYIYHILALRFFNSSPSLSQELRENGFFARSTHSIDVWSSFSDEERMRDWKIDIW